MQEILEKVDSFHDNMRSVAENVASLDAKHDDLCKRMENCEKKLRQEMERLKRLSAVSTKKEERGCVLLSRVILCSIDEAIKERQEIEYLLKKCEYHRKKAQKALYKRQEKVKESPEIYFYSR